MSNQVTLLHKVELLTNNGKNWDITANVDYIFINESLFNFHLLGYLKLNDGNNWLEKLPINSGCVLSIWITNNSSQNSINLNFAVTGVSDIVKRDNHTKTYNIQFVTPEAISNFNIRISKGYAGPSKAIVSDVLSQITDKPILLSKTEDDAKILAANMHPYKVIDLLNLYGSKSCYDFLLWENFRGLNYNRVSELINRPIMHNLMEKDLQGISNEEVLKDYNYRIDKENIISYYKEDTESLISYMRNGELGNSTYTYNSLNGMPYQYNVNENFKDNVIYHFNEDTLHYQNYGSRHKILNELINNEFFITAAGDYDRCSGDMCYVEINGRSRDIEYASDLSGNFLITRIEHEFTLGSYKQTIGLSR